MKIIKRIIILVAVFILIFGINIKNSYANNTNSMQLGISISDIFSKAKTFEFKGNTNPVIDEDSVMDEFVPVGQILFVVANAVIVVVVAIMGIKWIIANPEQQAKLKHQLIGLVFSIFVIYGAVGIWSLVSGIMKGF